MGLEFRIPYDECVRWLDGYWRFLDFGQMKVVEMLGHVMLVEGELVALQLFLRRRLSLGQDGCQLGDECLIYDVGLVELSGRLMTMRKIQVEVVDMAEK